MPDMLVNLKQLGIYFQHVILSSYVTPYKIYNSVCKWFNTINMIRYWYNAYVDSNVDTGGRLNKKDGLTRYGDSHVKDKTS